MILVLSLNSAVDKTYFLPSFQPGRLHRPVKELALPGGKGINVARVLKAAGEPVRVVGCVAGAAGRFIREGVAREGIQADWIEVSGESRTCLAVVSSGGGSPTEINESGPVFKPSDVAKVRRKVLQLLPRTEVLVCSGSLPRGVPVDFYAGLIKEARKQGVATALDTSGPALLAGLRAGPQLAKPNESEIETVAGPKNGHTPRALLEKLTRYGVTVAAVTLGDKGLIATEGGRYWNVRPPRLDTVSAIGCGDTLLAGLVLGWREGWTTERALKEAVAMAAANALSAGAGVFKDSDRRRILPKVILKRI